MLNTTDASEVLRVAIVRGVTPPDPLIDKPLVVTLESIPRHENDGYIVWDGKQVVPGNTRRNIIYSLSSGFVGINVYEFFLEDVLKILRDRHVPYFIQSCAGETWLEVYSVSQAQVALNAQFLKVSLEAHEWDNDMIGLIGFDRAVLCEWSDDVNIEWTPQHGLRLKSRHNRRIAWASNADWDECSKYLARYKAEFNAQGIEWVEGIIGTSCAWLVVPKVHLSLAEDIVTEGNCKSIYENYPI